jgi:energy-coupling factor transporter transmembrane protein EcfT
MKFDPRAHVLAYGLAAAHVLACGPAALLAGEIAVALLCWRLDLLGRWWRAGRSLALVIAVIGLSVAAQSGTAAAGLALGRLILLLGLSALLFASLDPARLSEALIASGLPAQQVFLLEGTLRFIPLLETIVRDTVDAQACRGVRLDGWRLALNGPLLITPILINALRAADLLAEALEARGFGSSQRTIMGDYRWAWRDWLLIGGLAGGLLLNFSWRSL